MVAPVGEAVHGVAVAHHPLYQQGEDGVRREILVPQEGLFPGIIGKNPLGKSPAHAPLQSLRRVLERLPGGKGREAFCAGGNQGGGVRILPPLAGDEITVLLKPDACLVFRVFLEHVPAQQHIASLPVAGDDAGLRRADDAQGDDRVPGIDFPADEGHEVLLFRLRGAAKELKPALHGPHAAAEHL